MPILYPSLLGIEQSELKHVLKKLDPYVDGYHVDIMDNQFVPNVTWDAPVVNEIAQLTERRLWVHLMVMHTEDWLDTLLLPSQSIVSFHYEAVESPVNLIHIIKEKGWFASIAINPDTSVEKVFPILSLLDQVLIMSVQPGFSGQLFIPFVVNKLEPLVRYRALNNLNFRIGMDGGIKLENIEELVQKGVDDFAVASGIFNFQNPIEAIKLFKDKFI